MNKSRQLLAILEETDPYVDDFERQDKSIKDWLHTIRARVGLKKITPKSRVYKEWKTYYNQLVDLYKRHNKTPPTERELESI